MLAQLLNTSFRGILLEAVPEFWNLSLSANLPFSVFIIARAMRLWIKTTLLLKNISEFWCWEYFSYATPNNTLPLLHKLLLHAQILQSNLCKTNIAKIIGEKLYPMPEGGRLLRMSTTRWTKFWTRVTTTMSCDCESDEGSAISGS